MPLAPGSRIGSHVVLALIGQGGMGEVYRARDTTLDREVAIKRLPDAVAADPDRLARFEREAKTLAALNHPNVAQIYAVESGTIVMELIPGATLSGPLPLETALNYAGQIASALDAAHEKGIIHRDLKPGNVMLTPDGVIKVLDFSLAGRERAGVDQDPAQSPTMTALATQAGMIMGTAAYMAPEQAAGKLVDKRADIFAFGVVLWEILTGRRMFEGETVSHVLAAVLTKEPDLTAVPPRVRPLLARCLEKDPKKRLRDIGDALSLVPPVDSSTTVASAAFPAPSRARRLIGIGGWIAAGTLAAAVAALAWSRPAANVEADAPAVLVRIPRAVDIYNQASSAFAVSSDGLKLAYYDATSDGQRGVFVRTLATGEVREIPNLRTFGPRPNSLFWSPDSRQLVRGAVDGATVVDITTGATRALCDCRFNGGSWNKEGIVLLGWGQAGEGIRRVSAGDRTPVAITKVNAERGEQDAWPVFLPDGRRFIFTRSTGGAGGAATYAGSLDGGEPTRIADGSYRVFIPQVGAGSAHLVGINATGAVVRAIDPARMTVTGPAIEILRGTGAVSASENGILVVSSTGTRMRTIPTWFDRKGPIGPVGEAGNLESLGLSADGRKLVVTESASASEPGVDLWLRDLGSGTRTRLTFGRGGTAVWSPDGRRVVYTSQRNGVALPYQRAADGTGNETPFFSRDHDTYVNDWSSDGRWLIYSFRKREQTDNDLWMVPVKDGTPGTPAPYIEAPGKQQQAQFSPDGRFVAYGSDQTGTFEIHVQPFPDASSGKWIVTSGGGVEPRWSRDGKELFYFSGQTLMTVPVTTTPTFSSGRPAPLFSAPVQAGYTNDGHRWQVAPDGKRFLLLIPDGQQQGPPLEVIANWPALLKQ